MPKEPCYKRYLENVEKNKSDILSQTRKLNQERGSGFIYKLEDAELLGDNDSVPRYCTFSEMNSIGISIKKMEYNPDTEFLAVYIDSLSEKLYGPFRIVSTSESKRNTTDDDIIAKPVFSWKGSSLVCSNPFCWQTNSLKKCGRCLVTVYCSTDCQKEHWPSHIHDCRQDRVFIE
jgi:hypothetical protein